MNASLPSPPAPRAPTVQIGFDWGDSLHAIALQIPGQPVEVITLEHSAEKLFEWREQLQTRCQGLQVDLAIESTRGAVVYSLLQCPWIRIFPIHPTTSSKHRSAFRPSGAKDDVCDALVLLDILQCHGDRLRQLELDDPATRLLGELAAARRKAVNRRTLLTNQLISSLKDYFPQALALFGEKPYAPMALDFLRKWSSLPDLKAAKEASLGRFFRQHNVRSQSCIDQRLDLIRAAQCLTTDEAIVATRRRVVALLVDEIEVVQSHIEQFEDTIHQAFGQHPDHALFDNLPGAGANLAPRLLSAFGSDRTRFESPEAAQRFLGVAPVTEASGARKWVHWRRSAPCFLRQTLVEWAGQTVKYSPWAKAFYERQIARGSRHWGALRALAYKWVRILWKSWQTRAPYDESRYLKQLELRGSPIAARAQALAKEMAA